MSENLDLPWPLCLGIFDEESCRYFLYQVGCRVVPNYPFLFGIEEVYGQILERYGSDGTSDATSLLQELLEDTENASGLGDDGDIWRSWRHGWRHRNDDALNPFVPRFGSFILRPSTSQRIRLLRSCNFVRESSKCCNELTTIEAGYNPDKTSTSMDVQMDTSRECPAIPIERQDNEVLHHSSPTRVDNVNNMMVQSRSCSSTKLAEESLHENEQNRCSLAQDPTLSALFEMLESGTICSTQLRGGERSSETSGESRQAEHSHNRLFIHETSNVIERPDLGSQQDGYHGDVTNRTTRTNSVAGETISPVQQMPLPALTPDYKKREAHRQARLIDGAIFTSRNRRSKTLSCHQPGQLTPQDDIPTTALERDKPQRLSWSPVKRQQSLRSNWTRDLRQLFHLRSTGKQTLGKGKHQSILNSRESMNYRRTAETSGTFVSHSHSRRADSQMNSSRFGLDGASDSPPKSASPIDLNKPLPLSPADIVRSMSSRSQLRSSHLSGNNSNIPSATSSTSSISQTSSRKDFKNTARDLIQLEMLGPHELPPIQEVDSTAKSTVDPEKSLGTSVVPISYASIAKQNPFQEMTPMRISTRPPPLDLSKSYGSRSHQACNGEISQRSGKHLAELPQPEVETSDPNLPNYAKMSSGNDENEASYQTRGRKRAQPSSPTQPEQENLPPKTPTKRSRSPIKRFLGLVKSNSTPIFEDKEVPPPLPVTPSTSKKDSLKKWGDRLRYGFLTADQEQLRQEELIEAHNNTSTSSTPQNSTFPVSLEPPVQAKIQSEIELIVAVTANRFLMRESRAGRISAESVAKVKELWEKMNRPQVVEFHYDQLTQHNLVMANLDRIKLCGDASKDAIAINSTMRGWKTLAREMSVRTFCSPDSVIRKHLHDAHRVLELLGAPLVTFLAYEDMQLKTLAKINQRQRDRLGRRAGSAGRDFSNSSHATLPQHRRNASEGSYCPNKQLESFDYPITALQMDKISLSPSPAPIRGVRVRKATGAEGAIMSLPTNLEKSREGYAARMRDVKIGKTVKEI